MVRLWDDANQYLISKIIRVLGVEERRNRKQLEMIQYSLMCILNESEKFILLCVVFALQGYMDKFLIGFATIGSLRIFMGGSHRKTSLGCFIQSLLSFEVILCFNSMICINVAINYVIWILTIMWIWKYAPVCSVNRARYNDAQCMRFKALALTVLTILIMTIGIVPSDIANLMSWAIVLQLAESGMMTVILRKEEERNA